MKVHLQLLPGIRYVGLCRSAAAGAVANHCRRGYQVIINLGLSDGKYALADEAGSVKNLGLTYHHIPVIFDNPQLDELNAFIGLMDEQHAIKKHWCIVRQITVHRPLQVYIFLQKI